MGVADWRSIEHVLASRGLAGAARPPYLPTRSRGIDWVYRLHMSRTYGLPHILMPLLTLAAVGLGCQSVPTANVTTLPPASSLLAVDIRFPAPWNREASLVQVYFVRKPDDDRADKLPELINATFVKWHRAYLLDPEPGT